MIARPTRRAVLALGLAVSAARAEPVSEAGFADFLARLWPDASAQNVSRATFESGLAGVALDGSLRSSGARQPEFERTIKAYLDDAVSAGRIARGQAAAHRFDAELRAIESRFGVPRAIMVAIWGVESDFGRLSGDRDALRSLASLAYLRQDASFRDEVVAAMVMLERGDAARAQLKGSWAGAMGQPQFLPSAYLRAAVSLTGGHADIWSSAPDALASIGHFMQLAGWRASLPWGGEVVAPPAFDWAELEAPFPSFAAQGFRFASGAPLPAAGNATLFAPAGARGPLLLLSDNYWTIKQYNNSDSYALSVALLGDRIMGAGAIRASWPPDLKLLSRQDRLRLQQRLSEGGFYDGLFDGRFGPKGRAAIHAFQRAAGIRPADGFASADVLAALDAAR